MNTSTMKISVIIPTLNAETRISQLIESILKQTVTIAEIIVLDSESMDHTVKMCSGYEKTRVISVKRADFDHGKTRDLGMTETIGDIVFFFTDDAIIGNSEYMQKMLKHFDDEDVAMVTGRQIARDDASLIEKLTREFNYPEDVIIKTRSDIEHLGIKAFFASDVCSAYRKSLYEESGGFEHPIISNEDMLIAAKFLYMGKKVVYAGDAEVIHSHSYTLKQQFKRNFDVGVFLKTHSQIFESVPAQSEGVKMVKWIMKRLAKKKALGSVMYYPAECAAKLLGHKFGLNFDKLSRKQILACTANKNYWKDDVVG